MLKYCASVMNPKDLKSMIFKHQTHILGSLGFQIHSNTQNIKSMTSKHENHILGFQIHKTKNRKWKERKKTMKFEISNEKQVRVHNLPILNFKEAVSSIIFVDIAFKLNER